MQVLEAQRAQQAIWDKVGLAPAGCGHLGLTGDRVFQVVSSQEILQYRLPQHRSAGVALGYKQDSGLGPLCFLLLLFGGPRS